MTIEEAVRHCYEVAENNCTECGKQHLQFAEWLRELDRLRIENSALRLAIASVPEMDWIPCSERLPEKDGRYLCVWIDNDVAMFLFSNKHFRLSRHFSFDTGEIDTDEIDSIITHWMPLPEPPEDKEDENV